MKKTILMCVVMGLLASVAFAAQEPAFDKLDSNDDEKVSYKEFLAGWHRAGADRISFKPEDVDVNKDGKISWKEMELHFKHTFEAADKNQDAYLDRSETFDLFKF